MLNLVIDGGNGRGYISLMTPNQLTALRKRTGLERSAFADLLGVERTTIWRWETGSRKIDRFTEEAIKRLVERLINETA